MGETQDSRNEKSGVIRKMPGKENETGYGGFAEQNIAPLKVFKIHTQVQSAVDTLRH